MQHFFHSSEKCARGRAVFYFTNQFCQVTNFPSLLRISAVDFSQDVLLMSRGLGKFENSTLWVQISLGENMPCMVSTSSLSPTAVCGRFESPNCTWKPSSLNLFVGLCYVNVSFSLPYFIHVAYCKEILKTIMIYVYPVNWECIFASVLPCYCITIFQVRPHRC